MTGSTTAHPRPLRPQHFQRSHNLARVMRLLREGPASRSALAEQLHLDRSTLTHLANDLLGAELIVEDSYGRAGARGGRRPRLLRLNPDRYFALGCDLQAHQVVWRLVSLDGTVRADGEIERPPGHEVAEEWMAAAVRLVRTAIEKAMVGAVTEILCAGVSVPGLIDVKKGVLIESTELGARALPVASHWGTIAGDVYVDNDARCSAWQLARGASGHRIAILVQVKLHQKRNGSFRPSGAGIGLAYLVEGAFFNGSHRAAGELRGVDWTSGAPDQLGLSLEAIAAEHGRDEALRRLVHELLRNLSVVISAFDPDIVVLAGDLTRHRDLVARELSSPTIRNTVAGELAAEQRLVVAAPNQYPPVLGATGMALDYLFGLPGVTHSVPGEARLPVWRTVLDAVPLTATPHSG